MYKASIETVWQRIREFEGQPFVTKRGLTFRYEVDGSGLIPSRTEYRISKQDFGVVLKLCPVSGPGEISDKVRGPSYIWSILHDPRIRRRDW